MQFTGLRNSIPDGEQFFQETRVPVLTWEGKCLRRRANPAHLEGHLPAHRYMEENRAKEKLVVLVDEK